MAQRRAAGSVGGPHAVNGTSVTDMLRNLNCPLEQRHIDCRLVMMYKITYNLVTIPASDHLIPDLFITTFFA